MKNKTISCQDNDKTIKGMVSVLIVNWNGKKWIKKCIDSLLNQTYPNFEIIFVDNASSDNSVRFVKEQYPEVIIVESKENIGFAGGNNLGIKISQGEYILLLNNDAWLASDFLEKALGYLYSEKLDVVGPVECPYEGTSVENPHGYTIDLLGHPVKFNLGRRHEFYVSGCCLLCSRYLYEESGGLDSDFFMYFEEIDWCWRLHLLGKQIATIPTLNVYHAGHCSTGPKRSLNENRFLWRNENCLAMLIKNYSTMNLCWAIPGYLLQVFFEAFCFFIIGRVVIAKTYWRGICRVVERFPVLIEKRKKIQYGRCVSDIYIWRLIYKGPGKIRHLVQWISSKYNMFFWNIALKVL